MFEKMINLGLPRDNAMIAKQSKCSLLSDLLGAALPANTQYAHAAPFTW